MRRSEMYCDHCGKVIDPMADFDDTTIEMAHKWTTADLCAECLEELYDIVLAFCKQKGGDK